MSKLLHSQQQLLVDWADNLRGMFNEVMVYQVGTSLDLVKKPYRDVDVRVMLEPKDFKKLKQLVNVDRLNLAVSVWGQQVTGLPIDFQVQDRIYANKTHKGHRSAIGIRRAPILGDGQPKPTNPNPRSTK